jgi:hypothetical protein
MILLIIMIGLMLLFYLHVGSLSVELTLPSWWRTSIQSWVSQKANRIGRMGQ